MGNCQTVDAAALVIQHPNGQTERKYWTVSASEVMKLNPGHYVSLIIPLPSSSEGEKTTEKTVKFTRVKLLRPSDTLVLGRAYRLVTSQGLFFWKKYGFVLVWPKTTFVYNRTKNDQAKPNREFDTGFAYDGPNTWVMKIHLYGSEGWGVWHFPVIKIEQICKNVLETKIFLFPIHFRSEKGIWDIFLMFSVWSLWKMWKEGKIVNFLSSCSILKKKEGKFWNS